MNTPTHAIVALAALSRPEARTRNLWVLSGALIPDVIIFLWTPWQRWGLGRDWDAIWDQHYFEAPMQTWIALFNSVPIYAALLLIGWWHRQTSWGPLLMVFAAAALLHIAVDMPVHGHDAYRHFWPISDWRFFSPVSYWESDLHARWVSLIEAGLVLTGTIMLWRRFPKIWVRVLISILLSLTLIGTTMQQLAAMQVSG